MVKKPTERKILMTKRMNSWWKCKWVELRNREYRSKELFYSDATIITIILGVIIGLPLRLEEILGAFVWWCLTIKIDRSSPASKKSIRGGRRLEKVEVILEMSDEWWLLSRNKRIEI